MCRIVFKILDFHTDDSSRRGSVIIIVRVLDGQKVGREGGVQGAGQQDELERDLLLQLDRNGISFLKDYGIIDFMMRNNLLLTFRKTALPQRSSLKEVN